MAYVNGNPKSGAEIKRRLAAGETLTVFQPGPWGPEVKDGRTVIEGPHYPAPHKFWVSVEVKDGAIVKILK